MTDQEDEKVLMEFDPQDFVIRITPLLRKNKWTGQVNVSINIADDMFLNDEDYANVLHFCRMLTATVPMMEEMKSFRELINDYALNELDKPEDTVVKPKVVSRKDNVVRVSFNPKTNGGKQ